MNRSCRPRIRAGIVVAALGTVVPVVAAAGELEDRFATANRMYEEGRFAQAASEYEAILQYGLENENLYYNLGNAYFKMADLGPALLNFERAHRLAPGDREIRENLDFARSLLYDRMEIPAPPFPFDVLIRVRRSVSLDTETILFVVLYLIAAGFLSAYLLNEGRSSPKLPLYGLAISLLLCTGVGVSLGAHIHALRTRQFVIILSDAVDVRSGPGPNQTVLFTVHEGLKAEIRTERGDWLQVSLPNGWNGWIPRASAGII